MDIHGNYRRGVRGVVAAILSLLRDLGNEGLDVRLRERTVIGRVDGELVLDHRTVVGSSVRSTGTHQDWLVSACYSCENTTGPIARDIGGKGVHDALLNLGGGMLGIILKLSSELKFISDVQKDDTARVFSALANHGREEAAFSVAKVKLRNGGLEASCMKVMAVTVTGATAATAAAAATARLVLAAAASSTGLVLAATAASTRLVLAATAASTGLVLARG